MLLSSQSYAVLIWFVTSLSSQSKQERFTGLAGDVTAELEQAGTLCWPYWGRHSAARASRNAELAWLVT
jgi:hypothetical protein